MLDPALLALITGTFLLAGTVKGVIGLGLPTVSLALLTATLNLPSAMALMLVPSLATNLWQAASGGHARTLVRRAWPFFLVAFVTVGIGGLALSRVRLEWLSALLGGLLVAYGIFGLGAWRFRIPDHRERWAAPLFGLVNGVLTGMTGSFVVPGVMYLRALGLPRDALVQAMGILFSVSTLGLALALGGHGLLYREVSALSVLALVPAAAGMWVGRKVRGRLSEQRFREVFFAALALLGLFIGWQAFGS